VDGPGGGIAARTERQRAFANGQQPRSLFHYDIHRNGLEISSMFQETACKEENRSVSPLFADALQEYGRGKKPPNQNK